MIHIYNDVPTHDDRVALWCILVDIIMPAVAEYTGTLRPEGHTQGAGRHTDWPHHCARCGFPLRYRMHFLLLCSCGMLKCGMCVSMHIIRYFLMPFLIVHPFVPHAGIFARASIGNFWNLFNNQSRRRRSVHGMCARRLWEVFVLCSKIVHLWSSCVCLPHVHTAQCVFLVF